MNYTQPEPKKEFDPKLYREAKEWVYLAEPKNRLCLLLYGGGTEWWKMGGNSLLMYKYYVCPRIKVKVNVRPDEDYLKTKFENGVVTFNGLDALEKRLAKAEVLKRRTVKDGIARFDLDKIFTASEIKEYKDTFLYEQEKIYSIIKPKIVIVPELHTVLRETVKRLYKSCHQMTGYERRCGGDVLVHKAIELQDTYLAMNRSLISESEGWVKLLDIIEHLQISLITATELEMVDHNTAAFVGANLIEAKKMIKGIQEKSGRK